MLTNTRASTEKKHVRRTLKILLLIIIIASAHIDLLSVASAESGVGLVWNEEKVTVKEGEEKCLMYGIYNPFDEDTTIKPMIIGEAKNFIDSQSSDKVFVRKNTPHERSQQVEICFEIQQEIYEEDCLVGDMMCKKACRGEPTTFDSEMVAAGMSGTSSKTAVGSSTEFAVAAPLDITVECVPRDRDMTVAYYASAIAAISLASYVFYRKFLKKKKRRKK